MAEILQAIKMNQWTPPVIRDLCNGQPKALAVVGVALVAFLIPYAANYFMDDKKKDLKKSEAMKKANKDCNEWIITWKGGLAVREDLKPSATKLGTKTVGTVVFGKQQGDWIKLSNEPGFILLEDPDGTHNLEPHKDTSASKKKNGKAEAPQAVEPEAAKEVAAKGKKKDAGGDAKEAEKAKKKEQNRKAQEAAEKKADSGVKTKTQKAQEAAGKKAKEMEAKEMFDKAQARNAKKKDEPVATKSRFAAAFGDDSD